ncbi:ABC transporter permease [Gracilibacillus kekensis]|uniref:ABC-2 type transport system permease protein n=1 Tax=Gracilibacillus kekensis TaxID=1027249 RepID=A0A1M7PZA3_9BACI|nr:ABC transporter permease [Gracilibacillus kekensis]SHN23100.1 ABC-2 type transport system permease protein [Gracilibacillus kekensis]
MKEIIYTRFLLLKKQWISLSCWIVLPILIAIGFLSTAETVQDDFNVPVGIVLEEESESALALWQEINESSLVDASKFSEREAVRKLEQHELDSVFIIRQGYEETLQSGNRRNLLGSYYSDRSFAYTPVKEMIVSIIQQTTGRIKAANTVINLEMKLSSEQDWSIEEIIAKSKEIQNNEDLLNNQFRFHGESDLSNNSGLQWNPWIVWAFATMLITIFIFDWVIKERKAIVAVRFPFMKISFPAYMLINVSIYIIILLSIDLSTVVIFYSIYQETINLFSLVSYRIMVCLFAFLFVNIIRNAYFSYIAAILWVLVLIVISGAVLPIGGFDKLGSWINHFNPLYRFLIGEWTVGWLAFCLGGIAIWYVREGKKYA